MNFTTSSAQTFVISTTDYTAHIQENTNVYVNVKSIFPDEKILSVRLYEYDNFSKNRFDLYLSRTSYIEIPNTDSIYISELGIKFVKGRKYILLIYNQETDTELYVLMNIYVH